MPEVQPDGNYAGDSSASNESVWSGDTSDHSAEQGPIPYDRFKEVIPQKNEAQEPLGEMQEAFRQREAQWAENPQNMNLLMSKIVMDETKSGAVKPYAQRRSVGSNTATPTKHGKLSRVI